METFLTLIKSKIFWGSLFLVACASLVGFFWISNSHLETQVTTLKASVDAAQITINEKTAAAQLCSDNTVDLKKREDALSAQAASAVAAAKISASKYNAKSKAILNAKPTSSNDAQSANDLFNSLIPGASK